MLNVKINLNNCPLTYLEEDIQLNVLTSNSTTVKWDVRTINSTADDDSDEWTKRPRYVQRCKENPWKRWKHEYLVALRERHNLSRKDRTRKVNIRYIVMINGGSNNRGHWNICMIPNCLLEKTKLWEQFKCKLGQIFWFNKLNCCTPWNFIVMFHPERGKNKKRPIWIPIQKNFAQDVMQRQ